MKSRIILLILAGVILVSGCGKKKDMEEVEAPHEYLGNMRYEYDEERIHLEKETRDNITTLLFSSPDSVGKIRANAHLSDPGTIVDRGIAYRRVKDFSVGVYLGMENEYAIYRVYIVPAEDKEGKYYAYVNSFFFNDQLQPTQDIVECIENAINEFIGEEVITVTYNELIGLLSEVYGKAFLQGNILFQQDAAGAMTSEGDADQPYEPQLNGNAYVLKGEDFRFIQAGRNKNQIDAGTYIVKWRSGKGYVGKTNEYMVIDQSFQLDSNNEQKVMLFKEGDRLIVTEGLEIVIEKR